MQVLLEWAHIAIGAAFWTCALWPAMVRLFWPWNRHEWGWNMVIKTELVAAALLSSILKIEFGITSGLTLLWTTVLAVSAIPLVLAWRTLIIWRTQRDGALAGRVNPSRGGAEPGGGSGAVPQEDVKP